MVVVLVGLEVLGQVRDPAGQHRHLDLGRSGVALRRGVVRMICFFTSLARATPHSSSSQVCAPVVVTKADFTPHPVARNPQDTSQWVRDSTQQLAGLFHVPAHLLDERLDGVEPHHPAQPLDELDAELHAVDVQSSQSRM